MVCFSFASTSSFLSPFIVVRGGDPPTAILLEHGYHICGTQVCNSLQPMSWFSVALISLISPLLYHQARLKFGTNTRWLFVPSLCVSFLQGISVRFCSDIPDDLAFKSIHNRADRCLLRIYVACQMSTPQQGLYLFCSEVVKTFRLFPLCTGYS